MVEREEEERRKSRKIKDINRMEEQEKELLMQIYACKMVDADDIKNNKEKGSFIYIFIHQKMVARLQHTRQHTHAHTTLPAPLKLRPYGAL